MEMPSSEEVECVWLEPTRVVARVTPDEAAVRGQNKFEDEAQGTCIRSHWFKVTDPQMCAIAIRVGPDILAPRTGHAVTAGQVVAISDIVETDVEQRFLRLADGCGWIFTHSESDGRVLVQEASIEEAMRQPSPLSGMTGLS
jgi:hypothetical protein